MLAMLLAALLALSPPAARADSASGVTDFTLDNGLQVLVIEDHRAPVLTHMVWYRVGAADDPRGKSGLAHFLEHLMFKGTDELEPGEFSRIVEANGGQDNAFTSWDFTGYFQRVAADRLELVMQLEADRMQDLQLTEAVVAPERDVVLEERGNRVGNDPGEAFGEQRRAVEFLHHPYGTPIIGWRHEIAELDAADAIAFYRRHYAPDNAILIVAGDTTPDEVRRLAETYYGPIPPAGTPPRVRPREPEPLSERRVILRDPRVSQPYLVRTYPAPPRRAGDQAEAAALAMLAELLGGGVTGHLATSLQFEQKVALGTGAFYDDVSLDPRQFGIYVAPADGVTLEQAEARLDQALAEFIERGPDPAHLERVKTQVRAAQIYALDRQESRARLYGRALTAGLTVADVQSWPAALDAVTPQDVTAAARLVFDRSVSVTGYLTGVDEGL
ncbi:insulinase family protein [Rhodobacteraceae bacterium 2CG4]|uniref:Insulinase family protein n=2 Tax=Halovulum marinum TaxID=2662447 RepID=A0A6L5Z479_9RHOB|nr:insulinase family protein [Halovulum marinum]